LEPANNNSTLRLAADAIRQAGRLLATELRLVKAEIAEKLRGVMEGSAMVGAGAVAALAAGFMFLHAAVSWLELAGLPPRWGYLLVGVIVGSAGAVLLILGGSTIRQTDLIPDRTIEQLRSDVELTRRQLR
jgi:hypothetical protein